METEQVTSVFKSPVDKLIDMCPGPDGGLFVITYMGKILQLNSSLCLTNTFDLSSLFNESFPHWWLYHATPLCRIPAPHNTLVVINRSELRVVSLQDGRQVWNQECDGFTPDWLLFCPK